MQLPERDRFNYDDVYMKSRLAILFAGRAAEEVFLEQKTTGASNDFERATQMARDMVMRYGMSDKMGVMVYAENEGEVFLGRSITQTTHISEETMRHIDAEVRELLEEHYQKAKALLEANRDKVEAMVQALMKWETIDQDQIADIMHGLPPREPKEREVLEKAESEKPEEEPRIEAAREGELFADEAPAQEAAEPAPEPEAKPRRRPRRRTPPEA